MTAKMGRGLVVLGVALVLLSAGFLAVSYIKNGKNAENLDRYAETITESIPEPYSTVIGERSGEMPTVEIDGRDFVALVEFPTVCKTLPVGAAWGRLNEYPCVYYGSAYEKNFIVGAVNRSGQLDFAEQIEFGDTVCLVDMTGGRYAYTVFDIKHTDSADNDTLFSQNHHGEDDFTLFVKNVYGFDYTIFRMRAYGGHTIAEAR